MNVKDFRRIALSFEGAEEGSHVGSPDFRVGERIFATLPAQRLGYGNREAYAATAGRFCRGNAGGVFACWRGMGPDGDDTCSTGRSERGCVAGSATGGVEATRRYKRKDPAQEREVLKAQTGPNERI